MPDATIEILGARVELTVMMTVLEVAGFPVVQSAFDVTWQLTLSLFVGIYVYTGLLLEIVEPLTIH